MSAMSGDSDVVEPNVMMIGVFTLCDDQLQGREGLGGRASCWVNRDGKGYPLVIQQKIVGSGRIYWDLWNCFVGGRAHP